MVVGSYLRHWVERALFLEAVGLGRILPLEAKASGAYLEAREIAPLDGMQYMHIVVGCI